MGNYPEPRAPWGPTARARPSIWVADPATSGALTAHTAPPVRERAPGPPPAAALKYERIDGTRAEVTVTDVDAVAFRFSGRPDSITLSARLFGALFTLTSRLGGEDTVILVPVNTSIDTFIARDTVLVRNAIAGSAAAVTVVGKWAALDEPTNAY